jgi:hypothetical protein
MWKTTSATFLFPALGWETILTLLVVPVVAAAAEFEVRKSEKCEEPSLWRLCGC